MDPALWELLRVGVGADGNEVIEAAIRLAQPGIESPRRPGDLPLWDDRNVPDTRP